MRALGKFLVTAFLLWTATVAQARLSEEAAQAVLEDDSFYRQWSAAGALKTLDDAHHVKEGAEAQLTRVQNALKDMQAACYEKFFVNSCIEDARKLSFSRERELRQVRNAADAIIRADKTREIQQRRASNALEEKTPPMKPRTVEPKSPTAPNAPRAKSVREKSEPTGIAPKQPREAKAPEPVHNTALERVEKREAAAAEKRAQEAENEARYAKKQAEAEARMKEAEKRAAERRADRQAQKANMEKSQKEREEAQQRLQEQQQQNRSSLSKYF